MHRHHHFAILFKSLLKPLIEANRLVLQWIEVSVALWWGYCLSLASLMPLCSCLNIRTCLVGLGVPDNAGRAEAAYSKALYIKDLCTDTQVPQVEVQAHRAQWDGCRTQHTLHHVFFKCPTSHSLEGENKISIQHFCSSIIINITMMCVNGMNEVKVLTHLCATVCILAFY